MESWLHTTEPSSSSSSLSAPNNVAKVEAEGNNKQRSSSHTAPPHHDLPQLAYHYQQPEPSAPPLEELLPSSSASLGSAQGYDPGYTEEQEHGRDGEEEEEEVDLGSADAEAGSFDYRGTDDDGSDGRRGGRGYRNRGGGVGRGGGGDRGKGGVDRGRGENPRDSVSAGEDRRFQYDAPEAASPSHSAAGPSSSPDGNRNPSYPHPRRYYNQNNHNHNQHNHRHHNHHPKNTRHANDYPAHHHHDAHSDTPRHGRDQHHHLPPHNQLTPHAALARRESAHRELRDAERRVTTYVNDVRLIHDYYHNPTNNNLIVLRGRARNEYDQRLRETERKVTAAVELFGEAAVELFGEGAGRMMQGLSWRGKGADWGDRIVYGGLAESVLQEYNRVRREVNRGGGGGGMGGGRGDGRGGGGRGGEEDGVLYGIEVEQK